MAELTDRDMLNLIMTSRGGQQGSTIGGIFKSIGAGLQGKTYEPPVAKDTTMNTLLMKSLLDRSDLKRSLEIKKLQKEIDSYDTDYFGGKTSTLSGFPGEDVGVGEIDTIQRPDANEETLKSKYGLNWQEWKGIVERGEEQYYRPKANTQTVNKQQKVVGYTPALTEEGKNFFKRDTPKKVTIKDIKAAKKQLSPTFLEKTGDVLLNLIPFNQPFETRMLEKKAKRDKTVSQLEKRFQEQFLPEQGGPTQTQRTIDTSQDRFAHFRKQLNEGEILVNRNGNVVAVREGEIQPGDIRI